MASQTQGASREPPDFLSHYTTLRGMQGIVDEGVMRMSNVSFLNDRRELTYGVSEAAKVIREVDLGKEWDKAIKSVLADFRNSKIPNTYAACFCEDEDVLSQWRAYSGSEQGLEIVFKRRELQEMMRQMKALFYPVLYGRTRTNKHIVSELTEGLLSKEAITEARRYSFEDNKEHAYSLLSRMLPRFKHWGFREEREWRFVIQHKTVRSAVKFVAKGHYIVPYLEVLIGVAPDLPIETIRIGPGREQDLTRRSVELYLASKQMADIEVALSNVPFRV